MKAWLRRAAGDARGAELVEFALALPLLLLVFGGIIDFGLILQRHQVLSNAAREGARIAVLPGYTESDVQSRVQDYVREGISNNAATPSTSRVIVSVPAGAGPAFDAARVTVTLTERFLVLGVFANLAQGNWRLGNSITLRAVSTMRIEAASGS